ncbi:melatonin receptor type 1B-B-like [Anneissia japonica]|uniref:melatonin receptor type 1B-B-like n=1 Tax=Anneissia japonica TaxID=1529436 RepID=UPI001425B345|nr:melatonin receptor type 1B-B-like [Anneissia japonica]
MSDAMVGSQVLSSTMGNNTTDDDLDLDTVEMLYVICLVLILTFGTVGNILIITAVVVCKSLRTKCNVFILNLAIADLFVATICGSGYIIGYLTRGKFYRNYKIACELLGALVVVSCICSLWNIMAIALNRYLFICRRRLYHRYFTWCNSILLAIAIWFLAIVVDFANVFGWGGHSLNDKHFGCTYDQKSSYGSLIFQAFLGFTIPTAGIIFAYVGIYLRVRSSTRELMNVADSERRDSKKLPKNRPKDCEILKTVLFIFIIFLICWMPFMSLVMFDRNMNCSKYIYMYFIVLADMNSCLNGVIYGVMNKRFRLAYVYIITCGKSDSRQQVKLKQFSTTTAYSVKVTTSNINGTNKKS